MYNKYASIKNTQNKRLDLQWKSSKMFEYVKIK